MRKPPNVGAQALGLKHRVGPPIITGLLEIEQGALRNGGHVRTLLQSQVYSIHLLCIRSMVPCVFF